MARSGLTTKYVPAYTGNYSKGRGGNKITHITIHHAATTSIEAVGAGWQKVGRRGSSNYAVKDNEIHCFVDENDRAWCDNNWESNCTTVSIETVNSTLQVNGNNNDPESYRVSDATLNTLIKLVADIAKRNGLGTLVPGKNLTWHSMYCATFCPGNYLRSKMQYIADEANKINGGSHPTPTPQPVKPTPQPTSNFLGSKGYFKYGDTHANIGKIAKFMRNTFPAYTNAKALGNTLGPNLTSSIKEFQKRCKQSGLYNDEIDGMIGEKTLACLKHFGFKEN